VNPLPPASSAHPSNARALFVAGVAALFTFGMVIALLGTLFGLPEMRGRLGIDLAQQGELFSLLSIGLLVSSILVGPSLERWGARRVLVVGSAMVAAALVAFALARGFAAAAAAGLVLGFGGGWLSAASNALVSDVYAATRGRMLNLLGMFFGVGALFVPLLVTLAFGHLSIPGTLLVCAGVALVALVVCAAPAYPATHGSARFSFRQFIEAARHPGVALLALLLFFQGANEISFSGWTSTYIGLIGWSPRLATIVLLGYWVVTILGRLLSARAQAALGKGRLVVASATAATVGCLVLLVPTAHFPVVSAGAWLTAIALSAIFPTVLAVAGDWYGHRAGTVFGVLFSASNLGSIAAPWALGHVSQAYGVRIGMIVPLGGTLAVIACAWFLRARERRVAS
jgi:MFS family permease